MFGQYFNANFEIVPTNSVRLSLLSTHGTALKASKQASARRAQRHGQQRQHAAASSPSGVIQRHGNDDGGHGVGAKP